MSSAGRKGVIELAAKGGAYGRQAMWEAMRSLRRFTLADLCGFRREAVREFTRSLEAGGYLRRVGEAAPFTRTTYELAKDVGLEAPKLHRDGTPATQGLAREQMWRAMKMLQQFTFVDLAVSSSTDAVQVSEVDARDYVKHLLHAGYLTILRPATPTSKAVHRLTKNTGPKPPMVTRAKVVFDPNLGRIAWHAEIDA
jgi:hypothetical protein